MSEMRNKVMKSVLDKVDPIGENRASGSINPWRLIIQYKSLLKQNKDLVGESKHWLKVTHQNSIKL